MPIVGTYGTPARRASVALQQTELAVPAPRWRLSGDALSVVAILLFVGSTVLLLVTRRTGFLTVGFPAMATAVGLLVLAASPARFVALALWLWMLSPFIRRVVDEQHGWNSQNPILLAPLLVCGLAMIDVVHFAPRLRRRVAVPFVLAILALVGGVVVGLFISSPALVLYAALSWTAPLLLGLHVAIHPEHHRRYHRAIVQALVFGVVLIGLYGIAQFLSPTPWDRLWMINSRMDSIGEPLPLRVRVFSTMNAPGPLAQFLSAGLLILLAVRSPLKWPAVAAGMMVFLLSLARSAWLGFAIGFVALAVLATARTRQTLFWMIAVISVVLLTISAAPLPPELASMRETIGRRLTTIGDLSMDDSFRARRYLVPAVLADIGERPLGNGLGATLVGGARGSASSRLADQGLYLDNGVLEVLLVLGWGGGVIFLLSAGSALWLSLRTVRAHDAGAGYLAGATALLAQVVGGTIFTGVGGAMFWLAVSMAITAGAGHEVPRFSRAAPGSPP